MLTRAEELQNLREMKRKIDSINSLEKKIESDRNTIERQKQRTVEDYPEYKPSMYHSCALEENKSKRMMRIFISLVLTLLPSAVYGIFVVIYMFVVGEEGLFISAFVLIMYYVPLLLGVVSFNIIPIAAYWWYYNIFVNYELPLGYQNIAYRSTVLLQIMTVVYVVLFIVFLFPTISDRKRLKEAKRKDTEERSEYKRKKAIEEKRIAEEKRRLKADISEIVSKCNKRINENQTRIKEEIAILKSIPGLADQDKNEYTVNKLITYFERGKVDSIKEAINLFDMEERDRMDREQQSAWNRIMLEEQMRADRERKELIEKQDEENRRRYNELKRLENERNEKVDEFIKEAKRKLDE